jgi:hypothetical protein
MEKSRGAGDPVKLNVASPQPAARHGERARMPRPPTGDRVWMA